MLPSNIDLTERRDFSSNFLLNETMITPESSLDNDNMTLDDYERLVKWQHIFGKKGHPSAKNKLFPKKGIDIPFGVNERSEYCIRCGRPLRIPWKDAFDLCCECSKDLEEPNQIPWNNNMSPNRMDEKGYDLFNRK